MVENHLDRPANVAVEIALLAPSQASRLWRLSAI
jgi:hypothetical protein